eukprot:g46490.t1
MPTPSQPIKGAKGLNTGDVRPVEDAGVGASAFPMDLQDLAQAALVVLLQRLERELVASEVKYSSEVDGEECWDDDAAQFDTSLNVEPFVVTTTSMSSYHMVKIMSIAPPLWLTEKDLADYFSNGQQERDSPVVSTVRLVPFYENAHDSGILELYQDALLLPNKSDKDRAQVNQIGFTTIDDFMITI